MADQVVDRITVGIPLDVELTRDLLEDMRDEVKWNRDQVVIDRGAAEDAANRAEEAAKEAVAWGRDRSAGVTVAPEFDPTLEKFDGMVWMRTDEAAQTITNIYRWDAHATVGGVYPGDSVFPGEDCELGTVGRFTEFKLASTALA